MRCAGHVDFYYPVLLTVSVLQVVDPTTKQTLLGEWGGFLNNTNGAGAGTPHTACSSPVHTDQQTYGMLEEAEPTAGRGKRGAECSLVPLIGVSGVILTHRHSDTQTP